MKLFIGPACLARKSARAFFKKKSFLNLNINLDNIGIFEKKVIGEAFEKKNPFENEKINESKKKRLTWNFTRD